MPLQAFLFDVDGTLLDTNTAHVNAWHRTLLARGHDVPLDVIAPEIGKGGDKLVPSVLGDEVEAKEGDQIREAEKEEFLAIARRTRFITFDGVFELLDALRARGVKTCLATSSKREQFDAMTKGSDIDLVSHVDHVVTKEKGMESKPAPDLVAAAVKAVGVSADRCVMIGDTPHDGEASRRAGVSFIGVLCGGNPADRLKQAGAQRIYRWPSDILKELDTLLR